MFHQCISAAFYVVLIWHYPSLTVNRVLIWKAKPGNVVYWRYLNVRLSLSLCLQCSAIVSRPYRVSLTLPGSWEHPRALEEIQDLRGGEDEEISPHSSTTMQILGVSFLLFWLIWGHSCALGGKGRHVKKEKGGKTINLASNCSSAFSRLSCTTWQESVCPTTSWPFFLSFFGQVRLNVKWLNVWIFFGDVD